jgi:hypothetical protein
MWQRPDTQHGTYKTAEEGSIQIAEQQTPKQRFEVGAVHIRP